MSEIKVERDLLAQNRELAARNRARLDAAGVKAINLMSSPGAGKTSLLERTIRDLAGRLRIGVIEGDVQTRLDAERVARAGAQAVQIETFGTCHLEAATVGQALAALDLAALDLVVIENVGNLVCPVEFDLGEDLKAAVLSLPEGDDKPAKYPRLFMAAGVLVINKLDLLPYLEFDLPAVVATCAGYHPGQAVFQLSCRTGQGFGAWTDWLAAWARRD